MKLNLEKMKESSIDSRVRISDGTYDWIISDVQEAHSQSSGALMFVLTCSITGGEGEKHNGLSTRVYLSVGEGSNEEALRIAYGTIKKICIAIKLMKDENDEEGMAKVCEDFSILLNKEFSAELKAKDNPKTGYVNYNLIYLDSNGERIGYGKKKTKSFDDL